MTEFEAAFVALQDARDGLGRPVRLFKGLITHENLRETTREFAKLLLDENAVFLCGMEPPTAVTQRHAEAAAWANLALLARATAAALKEGA